MLECAQMPVGVDAEIGDGRRARPEIEVGAIDQLLRQRANGALPLDGPFPQLPCDSRNSLLACIEFNIFVVLLYPGLRMV